MSSDATDPTPARRPVSRFEQLAKVVLVIALVVVAVAAGFVIPATADQAPERLPLAIVAVVLAAALPTLALFGLLVGAPWRRPVAGTALWFLVLSGLLETVTQGASGTLSVPFLAITAVFVLADRAPRRVEGYGGMRALAVGLGVAALVWYLVGLALTSSA
ncbi:MAG TPA: hypothetical protein VLA23_07120 [Candidatus Limnocylindrales bacterium]|nr:hypothetical protein [Candidatus Limnocylindrales bacterium]